MQRNMELVRKILLKLESSPDGWAPEDFGIQSFSPQEIGYHVHIMFQESLIEAIDVTARGSSGPEAMPRSLTWKGHEFLDLARDQSRWNRARSMIDKIGGAPISVWVKVLSDLLLQSVDVASTK